MGNIMMQFFIFVAPVSTDLDPEDIACAVPGRYLATLCALSDLSTEDLAGHALTNFHHKVAISCLDDYKITVTSCEAPYELIVDTPYFEMVDNFVQFDIGQMESRPEFFGNGPNGPCQRHAVINFGTGATPNKVRRQVRIGYLGYLSREQAYIAAIERESESPEDIFLAIVDEIDIDGLNRSGTVAKMGLKKLPFNPFSTNIITRDVAADDYCAGCIHLQGVGDGRKVCGYARPDLTIGIVHQWPAELNDNLKAVGCEKREVT